MTTNLYSDLAIFGKVYTEGDFFCIDIPREKYLGLLESSNVTRDNVTINVTKDGTLNGPLNSSIISDMSGIPLRTLTRDLKELATRGLIQRVGSKKDGYWKVVKGINIKE